jgi:hypothetical protein
VALLEMAIQVHWAVEKFCHTRQGHDGPMDGELRMEAAVER